MPGRAAFRSKVNAEGQIVDDFRRLDARSRFDRLARLQGDV